MAGSRQDNTDEIKEGERCPGCGGLLSMIGRRHRCAADSPVAGLGRTLRAEVVETKRTTRPKAKRTSEAPKPAKKPGRGRPRTGTSKRTLQRRQAEQKR